MSQPITGAVRAESENRQASDGVLSLMIDMMERRILPDSAIRFGIRRLCRERLKGYSEFSIEQEQARFSEYLKMLRGSPVAVATDSANEQHYELPPEFFLLALGTHKKYSCCYWDRDCKTLNAAETRALEITVERAEIVDGMDILELGCGWGSLSLFMAKKFPRSKILALSNSAPQREYITAEAKARGLQNLQVLTRDVSLLQKLDGDQTFDRVVSVEMFEHLRNYEVMLERVARWLKPQGKLFVHIFTHRRFPYLFDTEGSDNWMGRYFFTGGQMPSESLLAYFQKDLRLEQKWVWSGRHYQKTSEAWLDNMDANQEKIMKIFRSTYGEAEAARWFQRWRVFFMSCAELFGFENGNEWGVSHYLFSNRQI